MKAATRADRRASRLDERRSERRARARGTTTRPHSPLALLTLGGVLVGVLLVGAILALGSTGSGATSIDLRAPAVEIPAGVRRDGRSLGDPDAPVQIELWADFQCPACGSFSATVEPFLRSTYVADGTVRLTYRDLAFLGPESVDAAVAARIADESEAGFWPFHDLLFANQAGENEGAFSRERLAAMADRLGIDRDSFVARLDDPDLRAAVRAETASGGAAGIEQTPTLVINGVVYPGVPDRDRLAGLIEALSDDG